MFVTEVAEPLTEEEKRALTNWLKNETGIERIEILEREKVEEAEEIEDEHI